MREGRTRENSSFHCKFETQKLAGTTNGYKIRISNRIYIFKIQHLKYYPLSLPSGTLSRYTYLLSGGAIPSERIENQIGLAPPDSISQGITFNPTLSITNTFSLQLSPLSSSYSQV